MKFSNGNIYLTGYSSLGCIGHHARITDADSTTIHISTDVLAHLYAVIHREMIATGHLEKGSELPEMIKKMCTCVGEVKL